MTMKEGKKLEGKRGKEIRGREGGKEIYGREGRKKIRGKGRRERN